MRQSRGKKPCPHRHCEDLVDELQLRNQHTLSRDCNCGISTDSCTVSNKHLTSHTTGTSTTFSKNCTCGISTSYEVSATLPMN